MKIPKLSLLEIYKTAEKATIKKYPEAIKLVESMEVKYAFLQGNAVRITANIEIESSKVGFYCWFIPLIKKVGTSVVNQIIKNSPQVKVNDEHANPNDCELVNIIGSSSHAEIEFSVEAIKIKLNTTGRIHIQIETTLENFTTRGVTFKYIIPICTRKGSWAYSIASHFRHFSMTLDKPARAEFIEWKDIHIDKNLEWGQKPVKERGGTVTFSVRPTCDEPGGITGSIVYRIVNPVRAGFITVVSDILIALFLYIIINVRCHIIIYIIIVIGIIGVSAIIRGKIEAKI